MEPSSGQQNSGAAFVRESLRENFAEREGVRDDRISRFREEHAEMGSGCAAVDEQGFAWMKEGDCFFRQFPFFFGVPSCAQTERKKRIPLLCRDDSAMQFFDGTIPGKNAEVSPHGGGTGGEKDGCIVHAQHFVVGEVLKHFPQSEFLFHGDLLF